MLVQFLVGFFELLMMNDVCKGSSKADEVCGVVHLMHFMYLTLYPQSNRYCWLS